MNYKLSMYDWKNVIIEDEDSKKWLGYATYNDAEDNASGVESLTVEMDDGYCVEFEAKHIKTIQIVN